MQTILALDDSKEINIKPNKDGSYNIKAKYDVYDSDGKEIVNTMEVEYPKVAIKKFDVEILATGSSYGEIIMKGRK